jgi:SH3-like domain-containing protein
MVRYLAGWAAVAAALLCPAPSWALDFRSVAQAAVLYDAPSKSAKPLFAIARHTPVEVVVTLDAWVKVRDSSGDIAWIEKGSLSNRRTVMISAARAEIRTRPDDASPPVFECDKDVALELVEAAPPGWAKVRHRDGQSGYVRVARLWGL